VDALVAAVVDAHDDGLEAARAGEGVQRLVDAPFRAVGRCRFVEQVLRVVHVDHGVALGRRGLVRRRQVQPQRALAAEAGHREALREDVHAGAGGGRARHRRGRR